MPIVGAVVLLDPRVPERQDALTAMRAHPNITVAPPEGDRIPVVVDSASTREDRDLFDHIRSLPGVLAADPVFADFSDLLEQPPEVSP